MPEITSPTVWRRWLALELTRLRREAGLTQKEVAKALRCTIAKVSYIEGAGRPVVLRDLDEILLPLYRVPETEWPKYIQAAKDSRKPGWWESEGESSLVAPWFNLYLGLEQGAGTLYAHCTGLVHGLVQTSEYIAAVLYNDTVPRSDDEIAERIKLRLTRQEVLQRRPGPLKLWLTLDEGALHRVIGSPAVMSEQLDHIVELAKRPNVTVQVVPYTAGSYAGATYSFEILGFPFQADAGVVYVEHRGGALYLEEPAQIVAHRTAFDQIRAMALTPAKSATMLRTIAKGHRESS